jgi:hypothetical protein
MFCLVLRFRSEGPISRRVWLRGHARQTDRFSDFATHDQPESRADRLGDQGNVKRSWMKHSTLGSWKPRSR